MNLTPADVEAQQFAPALRGYQMEEVDNFLDDVAATLRGHEQRLREAQDRIRSLENEISSKGGDETTISRAFLAAQRSADALIAEAETQAAKIRRDAESEATRLVEDRDTHRQSILAEINSMRSAVAGLKSRLGELAGSVNSEVTAMESALARSEAEVREPTSSAETEEEDDDESEPAHIDRVQSIIDEIPTLDLTEEPVSRVSARPWERG
jgi:cell division initiation protein